MSLNWSLRLFRAGFFEPMLTLSPSSTVLTVEIEAAVFRRLSAELAGGDLMSFPEMLDLESQEKGLVSLRGGTDGGAGLGADGTEVGLGGAGHGTDGKPDIKPDDMRSTGAAPGESLDGSAAEVAVSGDLSSSLLLVKLTSSSEDVDRR